MNFLGHLYLSGKSDEIKIGNFIGDWVKGTPKNWSLNFTEDIRKGIILHRNIDTFTDKNPIVKQSAFRLKEEYGRYSGVIIDIFYDHFIAKNWQKYSKENFFSYTQNFYQLLLKYQNILPEKVQEIIPKMITAKRLESYATIEGINNALKRMSEYTSLPNKNGFAIDILQKYYSEFETEFETFFEQIILYVKDSFSIKLRT